jgi:nucleoside-diphosphate-sugar epimerase
VLDLAHAIAEITGHQVDIQHRPSRLGEIRHSVGSRSLSRAALGLDEPIGLRDGLRHMLQWLDNTH